MIKRLGYYFALAVVTFLYSGCTKEEADPNELLTGDWFLWEVSHEDYFNDELASTYSISPGAATSVILTIDEEGYYHHNDISDVLNPKDLIHLYVGYEKFREGGGIWERKGNGDLLHFDAGINELAKQPADIWSISELSEKRLILDKNELGEIFLANFGVFVPGRIISHMEFRKL